MTDAAALAATARRTSRKEKRSGASAWVRPVLCIPKRAREQAAAACRAKDKLDSMGNGKAPDTHSMKAAHEARRRRRNRGSTVVEFALTIPLFMTLLIGMLEYGYWFYVALSATSAAREGARQCTLVSLGECGSCDPTAARDYMGAIGLDGFTSAEATCESSDGTIMYTVDVLVDFPTMTGYLNALGVIPPSPNDGNTRARGRAVMRGQ